MFKTNFFYLFLITISLSYSQTILHKIVSESNLETDIIIDVLINLESSQIKDLKLLYKSDNQNNYLEKKMIHKGDNFYYGIIPSNHVMTEKISYYILLELDNNQLYSFPYENPNSNPIEIKINHNNSKQKKIKSSSDQGLQILSPLPNSRVYKDDLLISLSYFKLNNVDIDKTKVLLNNRDITDQITFNDNYFIYKPDFILEGAYNIKVIFTDNYNREMIPFSWSFTVLSKDKLDGLSTMFTHSGRLSSHYSVNNNYDDELEILNINFDYRPNFDFLKLRTKIKWSDNVSKYEEDKNRYLLQFKAPFVDLSLFDSYPYINQYVLNSYRVRGFNLNIDSKFFDFNIIQGDLESGYQGDPKNDGLVINDLASNSIFFSIDNYSFRRNIFAFNMGIGNPEKLFYNFNIVKSKDNVKSLSSIPNNVSNHIINISQDQYDSLILNNPDNAELFESVIIDNDDGTVTTNYSILYEDLKNGYEDNYSFNFLSENWVGETPKDNLVIGSNLKWSLDNQRINFNIGSSLSLLNQNTWEPILSMEILDTLFDEDEDGMMMDIELPDNVDFSEYEDIFKFSFNQTPLLPIDVTSGNIGLAEILTMPSLAYNLDLSLKYFSHNINMGVKQIGPEYYSLANPYLQTDIREQYINDRFRLINNKLFIDYGFKRIEDGIEVIQRSLSKTDKYNLNLNYYPGYQLPVYSLSLSLLDRDNGIDSLDVFSYQEYVGVGEPGADDLGYIEVSDTTNRRENTRSFKTNFSLSYNYKYYADHNLLFNISQLNKKDLLYDEGIQYDSLLYFSPQSFNQMMLVNVKSTWSKSWVSNINFNYNYYNYSKGTQYFQEQFLRQIDIKGYYYRLKRINFIRVGLNFSKASGNLLYYEIGSNVSTKLELLKNIFLDFNYEYRYRDTDGSIQRNEYFFMKASYNF